MRIIPFPNPSYVATKAKAEKQNSSSDLLLFSGCPVSFGTDSDIAFKRNGYGPLNPMERKYRSRRSGQVGNIR
jgi:hypothetical protein